MDFIELFSNSLPNTVVFADIKKLVPDEIWELNPEQAAINALYKWDKFDYKDYLNRYPDVELLNIDPIVHFVRYGVYESRSINYEKNENDNTFYKKDLNEKLQIKDVRVKLNSKLSQLVAEGYIVSLTSYGRRIFTVYKTIKSIMNQSVLPEFIVLWLAEDEFNKDVNNLPMELQTLLIHKNFKIKWTEDIQSYKKIIPALKKYSDYNIITLDDDILYDKNHLSVLINEHKKYPDSIIAHRCHRIVFDKSFSIESYNKWIHRFKDYSSSYLNFFTGAGGVLYPKGCFDEQVTNKEMFLKLCPNADDIWLWGMAIINRVKIIIPESCITNLTYIENTQEVYEGHMPLHFKNVKDNKNDMYLKNICNRYPEIIPRIIKDEMSENCIVTICDEKYQNILPVMLTSLLENKFNNTKYTIYIIKVDDMDLNYVNLIEKKYNININIVKIDGKQLSNFHVEGNKYCTASKSALAKFLIPELLPNIERCLYLDTDIIIKKDIKNLINHNLENKTLGVVIDSGILYSDRSKQYSTSYFNSGVIVIDNKKFLEKNYSEILFEEKKKSKDNSLVDQNVFNKIFCADHVTLPIKYNFLYTNLVRAQDKYTLKDLNKLYNTNYRNLDEILEDAYIVHFASKDKPWLSMNNVYAKEWQAIANKIYR